MGIDWCKKLRNEERYSTFLKSILEFTKNIINEKIEMNGKISAIYENIIIFIFTAIPEEDDKNA